MRIEVELRKLQAARPELGRLVPLAASIATGKHKSGGGASHSYESTGGGGSENGDKPQLPVLRMAAVNGDGGRDYARPGTP